MTIEEAIGLYDSRFWEGMSNIEIAKFQISEPRLCMPFGIFHRAVEDVLCRPVFTHEFASENLRNEIMRIKGSNQ